MEWLWVIQLFINLILVNSLFVWWKDRQARPLAEAQSAARADLDALEAQARQIEKDAALYRRRMEEQLRFLTQLCEQAQAILMRHAADGVALSASLEEEELKALRDPASQLPRASTSIPSVQELEVKKQAMRPEIPLDLRSLLRDQLT